MNLALADLVMEERQRQDLGDIGEMVQSFKDFGQLQPVVVAKRSDGKFTLVAGGRRLAAAVVSGWTHIAAEIKDEMTPVMSQRIELEENLRRKELEWPEEVAAIEKIHQLMKDQDPTWDHNKTAAMIGKKARSVFNAIELSRAVAADPELAKSETQFAATKKLEVKKDMVKRKDELAARQLAEAIGMQPKINFILLNDRAQNFLPQASDFVDLILTDPPWGVDYDKIKGDEKTFKDSLDHAVQELFETAPMMFNALKADRWCLVFWPTNTGIHEVGRAILTASGFDVAKRPLIWYKPNAHYGSVYDNTKQVNSQYETIFLCRKGDPRFNVILPGDVLVHDAPGADRIHPTQKPVALLRQLIEATTIGGETVCDPFAGSCSTGVAAIQAERHFLGSELDTEFAERGRLTLGETVAGTTRNTSNPLTGMIAGLMEAGVMKNG